MHEIITVTVIAVLMLQSTSAYDYGAFGDAKRGVFTSLPSLKEQLVHYPHTQQLECSNPDHVLVTRPNGKWACVYHDTATYLKWDIVTFLKPGTQLITTLVLRGEQYHNASYQITNADIESIRWNEEGHGLLVNITAAGHGVIVLGAPIYSGGLFEHYCDPAQSSSANFMVLMNGEETDFQSYESGNGLVNVEIEFEAGVKTIEIINLRPPYIQCQG
ncbi:MAG: hypothetical protein OXK17_02530 [Thaumarchaeota archaeon]|nr:hypothetical protein [Nitrososphaerota archaeon]